MDGVRRFSAMHLTPLMESVTTDPFPASYSDKVRQGRPVEPQEQALLTDGSAKMLDGPAGAAEVSAEELCHGRRDHPRHDDRRREAGGVRAQGLGGRVACVVHLPDGFGG